MYLGLLIFLMALTAHAIPERDTGNLGEIRQSILAPDAFQRIYGDGWVLMNGQKLKDDDALMSEKLWTGPLPDSRGVFLRSSNWDQSAERGNPEGNLCVGNYQQDLLKSHTHDSDRFTVANDKGSGHSAIHCNRPCWGENTGRNAHWFLIDPTGGAETRPRCVIVNTYIKVNLTPKNKQTKKINAIMDEIKDLPNALIKNKALLKVLDAYIDNAIEAKLNARSAKK